MFVEQFNLTQLSLQDDGGHGRTHDGHGRRRRRRPRTTDHGGLLTTTTSTDDKGSRGVMGDGASGFGLELLISLDDA